MNEQRSKDFVPDEVFKDLVDFPGYQVGDRGTVRSWKKCKQEWKVLKPTVLPMRLPQVGLRLRGSTFTVAVAKLVLVAHVAYKAPDELRGASVIFRDNDLSNVCATNLEWSCAQREPRRPNAKLTPTDVMNIRARLAAGERILQLAQEHDVAENTIRCIAKGQTWSTI